MTTRPFSPTSRARPRRSAASGAWHVRADALRGSPWIDSLEAGCGRTVVGNRGARSEEGVGDVTTNAEDQRLGKETTMSKWIGSPFESPSTQARSLEGRPLGMCCSVMLPEAAMLRLLELGSSFVAALGEQRQPMTGFMTTLAGDTPRPHLARAGAPHALESCPRLFGPCWQPECEPSVRSQHLESPLALFARPPLKSPPSCERSWRARRSSSSPRCHPCLEPQSRIRASDRRI